jgi:hypothetical protein
LTKSIPQSPYQVRKILANGVEIRDYPEQIWAYTQSRDRVQAFRTLAGYIFGDNNRGERIGMTAPVITEHRDYGTVMNFVMPEKYRMQELPHPNTVRIKLKQVEPMRLAAISFSGSVDAGTYERNLNQLLQTLAESGIKPKEETYLMQYDDPRTPPFMRRNEIAVQVEEGESDEEFSDQAEIA